jgi:hypothetical protein
MTGAQDLSSSQDLGTGDNSLVNACWPVISRPNTNAWPCYRPSGCENIGEVEEQFDRVGGEVFG